MGPPDWEENESYLKKFERLAFALVRTRPPNEELWSRRRIRYKNEWTDRLKGLAGPLVLALIVSIPYIAENSTVPIVIASLFLAFLDISLTVWCFTDFETRHGHCSGDIFFCLFDFIGEFPAFIFSWCWIQLLSSSTAAIVRYLSSIIDTVTGRHVEDLLKFLGLDISPFGAPMDILSIGVTAVPSILISLGMEESGFIKYSLFALTLTTTGTLFTSALMSNQFFTTVQPLPLIPDRNLYSKILSGASLATLGFISIFKICRPNNLTLTQHQHFLVVKKFSISGCVICIFAFLLYFIQAIILNKVQQVGSLWDGDVPLLWPLEGSYRIIIASLGISCLALSIFEFLIPLCVSITQLANEGLMYRKLRKNAEDHHQSWVGLTPLIFGSIIAIQAVLIDTRLLLSLAASSFMCINIVISASMLAYRYQTRPYSRGFRRSGHFRTRPRNPGRMASQNQAAQTHQSSNLNYNSNDPERHGGSRSDTRRLLSVSFMKNRQQQNGKTSSIEEQTDISRSSGIPEPNNAYLIDDIGIVDGARSVDENTSRPNEPRGSVTDFSMGSVVSGYESDSELCGDEASPHTDDTDIDAAVTEYQENLRVANLTGTIPHFPTPGTARRVSFSTISLIPCLLALSASLNRAPRGHVTGIMLCVSAGLLSFLLLVVISRQPQRKRPPKLTSTIGPNNYYEYETGIKHFFHYQLVPWLPAFAIFLHCCLLLEALDLAGSIFAFWFATGLIIYFSYGVSKSTAASQILKDQFGTSSRSRPSRCSRSSTSRRSRGSMTSNVEPSTNSLSIDLVAPLEEAEEPCVQINTTNSNSINHQLA